MTSSSTLAAAGLDWAAALGPSATVCAQTVAALSRNMSGAADIAMVIRLLIIRRLSPG